MDHPHRSRRIPLAARLFIVAIAALVAACHHDGDSGQPLDVVVFSDVHFDPFHDPSLFAELEAAPEAQWEAIFARSSRKAVATWGEETNYPLLERTLESVAGGDPPRLVIFGGDMLTHGFGSTYYALRGSQDTAGMQRFTLKTLAFFARRVRARLGEVPVVFALGNNDTYEGNYRVQPGGSFLADTAAMFRTAFIGNTADAARFDQTYRAGGYYTAEIPGTALRVVALNTVLLSPNAGGEVADAVAAQLDWLQATLADARNAHRKAWLLMHIPPGGDLFSTQGKVDPVGHVADAVMNWKPEPQQRFLSILAQYPDVVVAAFAGHTHMDEFRLASAPLVVSSAISPYYGNDPAFKRFAFNGDSAALADYTSTRLDPGEAQPAYATEYVFSATYGLPGPLAPALGTLVPRLRVDAGARARYRHHYYAGNDKANPIGDLNWPVYWCGITAMVRDDLVDCINRY